MMLRAFLMLLVASLLVPAYAAAGDPGTAPIPALIEQAKTALAEKDEPAFDAILAQLFERITGFAPTGDPIPDNVSDEEYINRMCDFDRVTEQIYSPEHFAVIRNNMLLTADAVVHLDRESDAGVRAITECVTEDGRPTKRAQFLLDEIAWAKTLAKANMNQAQEMAVEYRTLINAHPDEQIYKTRLDFIRTKITKLHLDDLLRETDKSRNEDILYQADLVGKADRGSLPAQLEVARRLETGENFEQSDHFAYYWYKRARQNGGGEAAQSGMDRLLPHLDEIELMRVENWLKKKYHPY